MKQIVVPQKDNTETVFTVGDLALYWTYYAAGSKMFGEIVKINSVTVDVQSWSDPKRGVSRIKIKDFISMNKSWDQERDTFRSWKAPFMINADQVEVVVAAQQYIVDHPVRAQVNSEKSFVKDILEKADHDLAEAYWRWTCDGRPNKNFSDPRIVELQAKLQAVDDSIPPLPAWATYGT